MLRSYLYRVYRFGSGVAFRVRRRLTPAGSLVLASLLVALPLGLDTLFSLTYQGLVFLAGLLVFSWIWARLAPGEFEGTRSLPRYGTAGQPLTYRVRLSNRTRHRQRQLTLTEETDDPRPSFEEFRDLPEPGEEKRNWFDRWFGYYRWRWLMGRRQAARFPHWPVPEVAAGCEIELTCRIWPRRRGRLRLTGFTVAWTDPLGLCRSWRRVPCVESVLILPKRYRLPRLPLPGTQQYQPGGVSLARAVGESEEFVGLRDYQVGDPLRHIHWRSWAKAGRPIVKEYQDEFFVRHALILDTYRSAGEDDLFEEAVSVAASFAFTIEEEDSLLDLLLVGSQAFCFTAGRGLAHPAQMLEILAGVPACRDKPFSELEKLVLRHAPLVNGAVCVLLDWNEDRRRLVERLQSVGVPVAVLVLVPAGGKPPGPDPFMSGPTPPLRVEWLEVGRVGEQLVGR